MKRKKKKSAKNIVVIHPENRISIARCREILNSTGLNYSDEEIIKIRDYLYTFAEWVQEDNNSQEQFNVLPLNQDGNTLSQIRA